MPEKTKHLVLKKKPEKHISFRVSEERQKELKHLSADRGESVQSMLERGLELLESGADKSTDIPKTKTSKDGNPGKRVYTNSSAAHEQWTSMLMEILNSRHSVAIDAVLRNLIAFHELVQRASGKIDDTTAVQMPAAAADAIKEFYRYAEQLQEDKNRDRKGGAKRAG